MVNLSAGTYGGPRRLRTEQESIGRRSSVPGVNLSRFWRTVPTGHEAFVALVADRTNL